MPNTRSQEVCISTLHPIAHSLLAWILGGEWDNQRWDGTLPNKTWVDSFTTDKPLYLFRVDGHMGLCNSVCLSAAKITRETPDPPGGEIDRDQDGEPTGILKDNAIDLVKNVIIVDPEEQDAAMDSAMNHVLSYGITFVQDMGSLSEFNVYERTWKNKKLRMRMRASIDLANWQYMEQMVKRTNSTGDDWFSYGVLKGYVDGSLGSHTAYQKQDYTDRPGYRGLLLNSKDNLTLWARNADLARLQVGIHAIGDAGNALVLDIYEQIFKEHSWRDRRWRIEHAQQLPVEDRMRFSKMNITAAMQPIHLLDDVRNNYCWELNGLSCLQLGRFCGLKKCLALNASKTCT